MKIKLKTKEELEKNYYVGETGFIYETKSQYESILSENEFQVIPNMIEYLGTEIKVAFEENQNAYYHPDSNCFYADWMIAEKIGEPE